MPVDSLDTPDPLVVKKLWRGKPRTTYLSAAVALWRATEPPSQSTLGIPTDMLNLSPVVPERIRSELSMLRATFVLGGIDFLSRTDPGLQYLIVAYQAVLTRLALLAEDPDTLLPPGAASRKLGGIMQSIDKELEALSKTDPRGADALLNGGPRLWTLAGYAERAGQYIDARERGKNAFNVQPRQVQASLDNSWLSIGIEFAQHIGAPDSAKAIETGRSTAKKAFDTPLVLLSRFELSDSV